ncbi:hypothetical protein PRA72_25270 [Klebsiella pneumoniae]|uniref:hypothetical protein n=1 Tax=Klebsiella pneumoniae TaxID=573 RepID=UPI002E815B90|nr:hypothetical protein [Klebsiella pneumoniae]MEE2207461.1 hypothetical protein [Klebsiella pneumoniae]
MLSVLRCFCLLSIFFSIHAFSADINDSECISPELMKYSFEHYTIYSEDDYGEVTHRYSDIDYCNQDAFAALLKGIDFLRKTKDKKIKKKYETIAKKEGVIQFFNKRVNTIILLQPDTSLCADNTAAFVPPSETKNGKIYICDSIKSMPSLFVASVILHEARHIDGFPHIKCTHGYYASSELEACDSNFKKQGAYAIQLGYLYQVYHGEYTDEIRNEVRKLIIQLTVNNFNALLPGVRKGGLLLDDDDTLSFYDGANETLLASFKDKVATMIPDKTYPVIFFKNGNLTKYDFTRKWEIINGDTTETYKKLTQSERNSLLDVFISSKDVCFLFQSLIKCQAENQNKDFVLLDMHEIKPVAFWYDQNVNENDMYVVGENRLIYKLPKPKRFDQTVFDNILNNGKKIYPQVTSYAEMVDGSLLGISPQGNVLRKEKTSSSWLPAKEFGDYKFKKILPFYWSKELEDL